MVNQFLRA